MLTPEHVSERLDRAKRLYTNGEDSLALLEIIELLREVLVTGKSDPEVSDV